MKHALVILVVGAFFYQFPPADGPDIRAVALVELFTSQGCSSCPAADNLVNDVIIDASKSGKPVIGLSFHVTYWNYLGWKDPYSSESFTRRQKKYALAMHLSTIYTPQVVVNGQTEFVGSDAHSLQASIASALRLPQEHQLDVSATVAKGYVTLHYSDDKDPGTATLNAAIVEGYVQNEALRGENKGLTLKHHNVVKSLDTFPLEKAGTLTLPYSGGTAVVVFVQDTTTLKILGAVSLLLK